MPSITVTDIETFPDGRLRIHFGKYFREWSSVEAARRDARANLTREDLIDLALGLMFFRQPNLGNPQLIEGRSVNIDFGQNTFGTVT